MAIAVNDLWAGGDPHYDEISLNTHPMPGEERLLAVITDDEKKKLKYLEDQMKETCGVSEGYIEKEACPHPIHIAKARRANEEYQLYREELFDKHPELSADVTRGNFDPTPPGKVGEVLGRTTMMAASAMGMLMNTRGGYYDGVEDLNGERDFRFGIELARRKGLPVLPYDLSINDMTDYIRAIREAHPLYTEPVFIHMKTTVHRARQLLMGMVPDAALYVKDEQGRPLAVVSRREVGMNREGEITDTKINVLTIQDLKEKIIKGKNILTAPLGISAKEAKELLRANPLIKEVPIVDEQGRIRHKLTKLNILHYEAMAKYKFDTTPHAGVAIGVSNTEDMIKRTEAAVEAGASFITFETAHAYRRDVVRKFQKNFMPTIAEAMSPAEEVEAIKAQAKDIRAVIKHMKAKYKDRSILIGFGTVTSPEAVRLLAALGVDVVKVGIGGGSQCTTFDATGVGGPPFRYFWDCGKAAAALGIQIMADGGIDRRRRTSMLAGIDGLGLQQFGTWYGGTAEAASPAILNDKTGKWEKEAYGEASRRGMELRAAANGREVDEDEDLVLHAEGQVVMKEVSTGQFGTVGGIQLGIVSAMASTASYLDSVNMEEYQKNARFRRISKTQTKVS
jgi:IMP dehydrogenase